MRLPRRRSIALLASAALVAALFLIPTTAGAAGGGDSAIGHGVQFSTTVDFSARGSNVSTDARGKIRVTFTNSDPNAVYTAEVTCMNVVGATATTPAAAVVSGRITSQPPGSGVVSIQV